jgi:hypothetical protein
MPAVALGVRESLQWGKPYFHLTEGLRDSVKSLRGDEYSDPSFLYFSGHRRAAFCL